MKINLCRLGLRYSAVQKMAAANLLALEREHGRICETCGDQKPLADFRAVNHGRGNKFSSCKACSPEKPRTRSDAYTARKKERYAQKYAANPSAWKNRSKLWAKANPERNREISKKSASRPEYRVVMKQNRRRREVRLAHSIQVHGTYTLAEWNAKLAEFDGRCARCGSLHDITADHIVPLAMGGSNLIENIQPLCRSCNSSKGVKTVDYASIYSPFGSLFI